MATSSLGDRIRNYRKTMGLTQANLGKMLQVSQVTIANYERGERFPRHKTLMVLAGIFDVSLDTLLDAPEQPEVTPGLPSGHQYGVEHLTRMLLTDPFEVALTYTNSWKNTHNLDLVTFYETVIVPVLKRTGDLWFSGEFLVSEEHLISDKVRELILIHANREWERNPVAPEKGKQWMGFCAPGEKHDLALLMFAQLLRLSGWHTYFLGTQVPFQDLSGIIRKCNPDVLGVSVSIADNLEGLSTYIRQIRDIFGSRPAVMVGGQGSARIPGSDFPPVDAITGSLREGMEQATRLVPGQRRRVAAS